MARLAERHERLQAAVHGVDARPLEAAGERPGPDGRRLGFEGGAHGVERFDPLAAGLPAATAASRGRTPCVRFLQSLDARGWRE